MNAKNQRRKSVGANNKPACIDNGPSEIYFHR